MNILDWTGRQLRPDKKGAIPKVVKIILKRLEIDTESWLKTVKSFDSWFTNVAGTVEAIREAGIAAGSKWFAGIKSAKTAFTYILSLLYKKVNESLRFFLVQFVQWTE